LLHTSYKEKYIEEIVNKKFLGLYKLEAPYWRNNS